MSLMEVAIAIELDSVYLRMISTLEMDHENQIRRKREVSGWNWDF